MSQADVAGKWLLGGEPSSWVRWLLQDPNLTVEEELSTEFTFIRRENDVLLKVREAGGHFLLLTELQLHPDPRMPRRMRAYAALAEEKYDLFVYPVVFRLLPSRGEEKVPDCYHSEFKGVVAHQDFRVVKAWEIEAREVVEKGLTALIPFVPLMKGADEEVIRRGVELLRQEGIPQEMEVVLALFASFVMDVEEIQKIMRWDMAVLRESPWYNQILQEGLQQGLQEGLQRGLEQGRQQGLQEGLQRGLLQARQEDLLHILRLRFDPGGKRLEEISKMLSKVKDADELQNLLGEALSAESLEAFLVRLNRHTD